MLRAVRRDVQSPLQPRLPRLRRTVGRGGGGAAAGAAPARRGGRARARRPAHAGHDGRRAARPRARRSTRKAKRALLTAYADTDAAIAAINRGADRLLPAEAVGPAGGAALPHARGPARRLGGRRAAQRRRRRASSATASRPQSHDVRDFLARNRVPYAWYDLDRDPEGRRLLDVAGIPADRLPAVFLRDGSVLEAPTLLELAGRFGLPTQAELDFYDLVIVGGGPAGLAAAVYGASEGLRTVLVEREAPGGQAGQSLADRELPRLPQRALGRRPRAPRARPGAPLRRRAAHGAGGALARGARPAARGDARGRHRARRAHVARGHRRRLPAARRAGRRGAHRPRRLLRRGAHRGRGVQGPDRGRRRRRELRRAGRGLPRHAGRARARSSSAATGSRPRCRTT